MNKVLVVLLSTSILAGCAHTRIEQGLTGLVGKNVEEAVARLGPPSGERQAGSLRVVEWNTFHRTATLASNGMQPPASLPALPAWPGAPVSFAPVSLPKPTSSLKQVIEFCKVSLEVDKDDVVRRYRYAGNFEGCYAIANALAPKA